MLTHGVAPSGLLLSTMIPVSKDKRASKSDSNNYRAIAISSILGNIFDSIVMKEQYATLVLMIYSLVLRKTLLLLFVPNF